MKKTAIILSLSGALLFGGIHTYTSLTSEPVATAKMSMEGQESDVSIQSADYTFENEYVYVIGELPVVTGMKDKKYQKEVNEQIENMIEQKKIEVEEQSMEFANKAMENGQEAGAYYIEIHFDVKTSGNMISILLESYTHGYFTANGINEVDSINIIDDTKAEVIELEQFVTDKETLNQLIQKEIEADSQKYYQNPFESIRDNQAFYVENGQLNVLFNEYEISPGYIATISIPLEQLEIAK